MLSLYNGASYKQIGSRTVLYLDGDRSYAETPAIPIQKISFSLLCWVKVLSLPNKSVLNLYSDWSAPHQFRLGIIYGSLCVDLRRTTHSDAHMNLVYFCNG
ncbi:hypothetical protein OS493_016940 [Desmophyllum pertusum]|uniref:Uncharacterized protein n=1 Tax=Desmophyllum pertusum TaxID=174260 RepID=A0A9X0CLX4_9CNID|nr:hypothetical protein OS493_016940 [Desmophyllum pertusum]